MKKFFKALALLLALVLVIGSLPVAAAEQSDFALKGKTNKKTGLKQKIIYIGGAKGVKADEAGTVCKTGAWANVAKLVKGFDADTMYIELESSDKAIVRTESGKKMADTDKYWIKAKGVGTATVTVKVFSEGSNGNDVLIYNEDLFVSVKKNAEEIKYQILDAEGNDVTGQKLGANTDYTVKLTRLNDEGAQIDTDLRNLEGDKDAVAIEAANDYTTLWKVNFKKSGKVTLKATAFQSKTYNKTLLSQDIEVTVGYDVASVAQSSIKAVDVTFKQNNVAGLQPSDFKAYYQLTDGTKYYASAVEKLTVSENVATVQFYSAFRKDTEYFLEYNGEAYAFKTAKIDADSVASIVVNPTRVKAGTETKISYKLLNADGLDITGDSSLNGYMTFENVDLPAGSYVRSEDIFDGYVYIQDAGVSGKIKVTYNWTNSQGAQKSTPAVEGQVYSVEADKWVVASAEGVVTANDAKKYVKNEKKLDDTVKLSRVTMDYADLDNPASIQIAVKFDLTDVDGNVSASKYVGYDGAGFEGSPYKRFELKSNAEEVVMLQDDNGYKKDFVTNKVGTATVVIYGVKDDDTKDVLNVMTIKVEEARKATNFTASLNKTLLNKAYSEDKIEITAVLKDQYGDEFKNGTYTIEVKQLVKGNEESISYTPGSNGSGWWIPKTTISANDVKEIDDGTVTIVIKTKTETGAEFKFTASFKVGSEKETKTYSLNLSGTTLDTNVVYNSKQATIKVSLDGSSNGYATSGASIYFADALPAAGSDYDKYTGKEFIYIVKKDNVIQKDLGKNFGSNTFTNIVPVDKEVVVTYAVSGSAITTGTAISTNANLLGKGSYTVEAYRVGKNDKGKVTLKSLGVKTFTVTDNQTPLTWTMTNNAEKLDDFTNESLQSAFKVTFGYDEDGNEIDVSEDVWFEYTDDNTTAYIKKIYYSTWAYDSDKNIFLGYRVISVDVDKLVKKGN